MKNFEVSTEDFLKFCSAPGVFFAISNIDQSRFVVYSGDRFEIPCKHENLNFEPFNQNVSNIVEFKIPENVIPSSALIAFSATKPNFLLYNNVLKTIVVYSEYLPPANIFPAFEEVVTIEILSEFYNDPSIFAFLSTRKFLCLLVNEMASYLKVLKTDLVFFETFDIFHNIVQPKTNTFSPRNILEFDVTRATTVYWLNFLSWPSNSLLLPNDKLFFSHTGS